MKKMMFVLNVVVGVMLLLSCARLNAVIGDLLTPPAPTPAPVATPTPTPAPTSAPFCHGAEILCLEEITAETLARFGVTALGGTLLNGTYQPAPGGGLEYHVTLDANRPYVIEFEIAGGLGTQAEKGFLLSIASTDAAYFVALQITDFEHWGNGVFRGYFAIADQPGQDANKNASNLITAAAFGCPYSVSGWGPEAHRIAVHFNGAQYQITVDDDYQSVWAGRERITPGAKTLTLMFGNSVDPGERFLFVNTHFRRLRIAYEE